MCQSINPYSYSTIKKSLKAKLLPIMKDPKKVTRETCETKNTSDRQLLC